jgi:hypothetical protein
VCDNFNFSGLEASTQVTVIELYIFQMLALQIAHGDVTDSYHNMKSTSTIGFIFEGAKLERAVDG